MVDIKLYAAPMEGLTTCWWRQAHRVLFGGADKYFTPFLSPNANLCFQQKELDEIQGEADTVPQLLTNRGDHFLWAARELYRRGYREVNFNLGCPSGTVTAKRKGAGLLAYPEELERCLGQIFDGLPEMRVSVKTRIGKNDPAEWEALLALYEKYPISELIVHPRVQKEFYRGAAHREAFDRALDTYSGTLAYNGDLFTVAEVEDFCRRMEEALGPDVEYSLEPKVDGLSVALEYRDGGDGGPWADGRSVPAAAGTGRASRVTAGAGGVPRPAAGAVYGSAGRRHGGIASDAGAVELFGRQL